MRVATLAAAALCLGAARTALAQCPDGSPPPCTRPAARRAPDARLALVTPLQFAAPDTALARLTGNLAILLATQLTAGELRAEPGPELAAVPASRRAAAARARGAGAWVDGSLARVGDQIRITVRLAEARTGAELATLSLAGAADSLPALTERVALVLLGAWWVAQPGPRLHAPLRTTSVVALRHYIGAMRAWGHGAPSWRRSLDSAVSADPGFMDAWRWLALPDSDGARSVAALRLPALVLADQVTPDSAARVLARASRARRGGYLDAMIGRLAAGGANSTGRAAAPFCRYDPSATEGQSTEVLYVWARDLRLGVLAGCEDTLAIAAARRALARDPGFVPAWSLLVEALVWRGDTAAARRVLARPPPTADTAVVGSLRRLADLRSGAREPVGGDMLTLMAWHDFDRAESLITRFAASRVPGSGAGFRSGMGRLADTPVRTARGQLNRLVTSVASGGGRGGPTMPAEMDTAATLFWISVTQGAGLAPDPSVIGRPRTLAFLDTLVGPLSLARADTAAGSRASRGPAADRQLRLERRRALARDLWSAAVLASLMGDGERAGRFLAVLDRVAAADSAALWPLALGARGELWMNSSSPEAWAGARRFFESAHQRSLTGTPERYRWLLARRAAEMGDDDEALALLRSITTPHPAHPSDHLAYYAPALFLEGVVLERTGRRDAALARFREYVALRRDADPRFQAELADARRRVAAIEGR